MLIVALGLGLGCGDDSASSKTDTADQVALSPQEEIHGSAVAPVAAQGDFWAPCQQEEFGQCAGEGTRCIGLGWVGGEKRCSQPCFGSPNPCPNGAVCTILGCQESDSIFYWLEKDCKANPGVCPRSFGCLEVKKQLSDDPLAPSKFECQIPCEDDSDCAHLDYPAIGKGACVRSRFFDAKTCIHSGE